jgi:hypothetical protein
VVWVFVVLREQKKHCANNKELLGIFGRWISVRMFSKRKSTMISKVSRAFVSIGARNVRNSAKTFQGFRDSRGILRIPTSVFAGLVAPPTVVALTGNY